MKLFRTQGFTLVRDCGDFQRSVLGAKRAEEMVGQDGTAGRGDELKDQ